MAIQNVRGYDLVRQFRAEAHRATAYFNLVPYPYYGFDQWETEKRGPVPKCRPYTQHIVSQQAKYLMGKGIHIKVEGDETLTKSLNDIWQKSKMQALAREMAVKGGNTGSVTLVWAYNEESRNPWQIRVLDPFDEGVVTIDPDDPWRVEKLRLYKPVTIGATAESAGQEAVQITDWTDELETIYRPVTPNIPIGVNTANWGIVDRMDYALANGASLDVESTKANEFKIVPAWLIQNRASLLPYGKGDLWTLWKHIDQLNLTADLSYKHSQTEVYPRTVYIDLDPANNESQKNIGPQAVEVLETTDGSPFQGKAENLTTQLEIREYISADMQEMVDCLYETAGSVQLRADSITNKGALTTSVIELIYAPLFQTTEEKRRCYGEVGICEFFRRMIQGSQNYGKPIGDLKSDIEIVWPNMVRMAEEDLMAMDQRKAFEVASGFTTQLRAVRDVATANGVQDVDGLIKDLGPAAEEAPAASQNAEENNGNNDKQTNASK